MSKCKYGQSGVCEKLWKPICPDDESCYEYELFTNADRIRSMSDEELAKIITSDLIGELIPFCQNKHECDAMLTINTIPEEWCMKCALDWLKEEHHEDD